MLKYLMCLLLVGLLGFACAASSLAAADPSAAPEAAPAGAPAVTPAPADAPASAPVAAAAKVLMIWDGDKATKGKGWVAPQSDNNKFGPSDTVYKGKKSLEFRGVGSGWIGCGWNWFNWHPADSRTDLSAYTSMRFYVRVTGDAKPKEIDISLTSNNVEGDSKPESTKLHLSKYVAVPKETDESKDGEAPKAKPTFNDGQWHEIVIPLKDFVPDPKKPGFDIKAAWEFRLGEWSADYYRTFTVNLDSVRFE